MSHGPSSELLWLHGGWHLEEVPKAGTVAWAAPTGSQITAQGAERSEQNAPKHLDPALLPKPWREGNLGKKDLLLIKLHGLRALGVCAWGQIPSPVTLTIPSLFHLNVGKCAF